jgi:hypothetical protein
MDSKADKWSPALQIRTVLLSVQALLSAPNPGITFLIQMIRWQMMLHSIGKIMKRMRLPPVNLILILTAKKWTAEHAK